MTDAARQKENESEETTQVLSHEKLEAQAATMRRALEDVWSKCGKEMWPSIGEALEANAGKALLEEIQEARYQRDLLRRPVRMMVEALDSHESANLIPRAKTEKPPDGGLEGIRTEFLIHELKDAKLALQYVEATPEHLAIMEGSLENIAACSNFQHQHEDPTDNEAEFDTLTRQIPRWVHRALNPVSLPDADAVETDERLAAAIRYEEALRRIATYAEDYSEVPPHEISHALMVDLPDLAEKALYPTDPVAEVEDFDENSIPF